MDYFLSIDCGLTKVKVNIFTADGFVLAEEQANTPLEDLRINTLGLKNIVVYLVKSIIVNSGVSPTDIKTVATSGHGNGIYLIGDDGVLPFGYSSMFEKSACYTPSTDKVFHLTNQTSWCGQPLPILAYLKNEESEVFLKAKKVLFCKDVIKYFLTGKISTEYTDASAAGLLNYKTCDYDEELLKIYGLGDYLHILPDITESTDIIGKISDEFASLSGLSTDTVVLGGMFDVNACMLGSGVVNSDKYCIIGGTWGINSAVIDAPVSNNKITQCCNFLTKDGYMCIDSAPTSCANLEWFLKNILIGIDYKTADDIVENQELDENLLYLPYIYSASDVNIAGRFIGLKAKHTYRDMLRAVFEGIVFEHARRIEKIKESGIVFDTAVLTGGAANGDVLCQMFADITGLKIKTVMQAQTGSLGGAILGSVAVGVYDSIDDAVLNMVHLKQYYYPQDNNSYAKKYELFKNAINK